ncbi:MAG: hypothetical protein V1717_03125 [Candidatus Micrarchaeota archaeon]
MAEALTGLDAVSIFLIGLALIATVLFARSVYKFTRETRRMQKKIQEKITGLEFQAQSLKSDFRELDESGKNKVDLDYLNKRIDALINLLNSKA